ncbi:hypothetical protein IQ13_4239 [Lacibacter cauensis]|uniref:Uncharacterized protein n=1 Tax=Lacibacter cauensis TaxID=510947 RepID=A0A562S9D7_9BACT|nr:hypothetical protein [Lacibacter cauensis]TWI77995.1 hypothetical protein IQ13_4239 [Lacibacter cauensis]
MFRKKQTIQTIKNDSMPTDRMAAIIVRIIQQLQERFVRLMKAIINKLGVSQSKIMFGVVLSTAGFYSLYIIGTALLQPSKGLQFFKPSAIQQPEIIYQNDRNDPMRLPVKDSITAAKIKNLKMYFDSLQKKYSKQYDSILQSRPGLIDSIRMLAQFYSSQQKHEAYEK